MSVETLDGVVENLVITEELKGRIKRRVARFDIADVRVVFRYAEGADISAGDSVSASGIFTDKGEFFAYAIKNLKTGKITSNDWKYILFGSVILIVGFTSYIGPVFYFGDFHRHAYVIPILLSSIMLMFGLMGIKIALHKKTYVKALNK